MIKNYQILKESIYSIIKKSNLDIGAIYFIFKDLFREIEISYYSQINRELVEESKTNENFDNIDYQSQEKEGE